MRILHHTYQIRSPWFPLNGLSLSPRCEGKNILAESYSNIQYHFKELFNILRNLFPCQKLDDNFDNTLIQHSKCEATGNSWLAQNKD